MIGVSMLTELSLTFSVALVASLGVVAAAPAVQAAPVQAAPVQAAPVQAAPARAAAKCKDPIVPVLRAAGWTERRDLRNAYAISWRESNHQAHIVATGSYGLFQIQNVWMGTRYWPSSPLDLHSNAKAAHQMWKAYSWRPWGLNADGTAVDTRDYTWSADRVQAWIWKPFLDGVARWKALPRSCKVSAR
jgi:hypothetical protein